MNNKPLYITTPLLPKLEDFYPLLEEIWASDWVTNNGPMHQKLEKAMRDYLKVPTAAAFNNGTIALLVALKMFDLEPGSEVVTTPMTFAATAHAIEWNGLKPVFADIKEDDLTIDPASVEMAITENTSAIVATHVYGSLCDHLALQEIATRHNLKLIYDAAHAFGAELDGVPVGMMGDATIFSFHATKLFNTIEGGLLTTPHEADYERVTLLKNFGIKNEEEVTDIGINGKLNELQAAVGLLNLQLVKKEMKQRAQLRKRYNVLFEKLPGIKVQPLSSGLKISEQYYPIVIEKEKFGRSRDEIYDALKAENIYARKYFYPICTDFEPYKNEKIVTTRKEPYADKVKHEVLCLPFHSGVTEEYFKKITKLMKDG